MLPKQRRISRGLLPLVLAEGKRLHSPNLLVYAALRAEKSPSLFAFSVSKKVAKKAVDRNRLRRRGYAVVSSLLKETEPGFLLFFSFKKNSTSISFATLEKEVTDLLHTSGVVS